ncbi:MAG: fibronectin type III domain-containing protein [Candidatus Parcubacteria bacterium]|nr:fibronectin type III domain-containing protein [Candidatus Parcubacteria bacterium]
MANNGLTTKVKTKISTKTIVLVAAGLAILGAAFAILPYLQPQTPPAPITRTPALVSLSVAPFSIVVGEKATLTAYVDSAKSCTPTGIPEIDRAMIGLTQNGNINQGTHSFSAKATVSPKTTTTYTLTCIGANDNLPKSAQAKLIVIQCVGGANTTHATLCPLEGCNVTTATPKTLVKTCSGLPAHCEFTCNPGYTMGPLQQRCIQCYTTGQNPGRLGSCCPGLIKNTAGVCIAPQCTGITPANSVLCPGDDVGLNVNTPKRLVAQCNDIRKCQYTCNQGYIFTNGVCVAQPPTLKIIDINGGDTYTGATKSIYATTYVNATCSLAYSKNSDTSNGTTILGKIVQTPTSGNDGKYYYAFNLNNLDGVSTYYYKIMCNIPGQAVVSPIKTLNLFVLPVIMSVEIADITDQQARVFFKVDLKGAQASNPEINYGIASTDLSNRNMTETAKMFFNYDSQGKITGFSASNILVGLNPKTTYYYQVVLDKGTSMEVKSQIYNFTTQ